MDKHNVCRHILMGIIAATCAYFCTLLTKLGVGQQQSTNSSLLLTHIVWPLKTNGFRETQAWLDAHQLCLCLSPMAPQKKAVGYIRKTTSRMNSASFSSCAWFTWVEVHEDVEKAEPREYFPHPSYLNDIICLVAFTLISAWHACCSRANSQSWDYRKLMAHGGTREMKRCE